MTFIKTNLNPTGKARNDCVIRAIMKANKKTWRDVAKELSAIALETYNMPNAKEVYSEYLKGYDWEKHKMPKQPITVMTSYGKKGTYRRFTVKEWAEKNPKGTFIISVANHLTVLVDGDLYDTWDCSRKSLGNYWTK